jgi:hypothetical protein
MSGGKTRVVNIAAFAAAHPQSASSLGTFPGEVPYDSDPYDVAAYRGGWVVADAGANGLLYVTETGRVSLLARFPAVAEQLPAGVIGNPYEEHDAPGGRVSAVCLEASPLAPLVRKLFSTRKIFTPYDQKVSAIKIVSALKRRSAPPGTGRTGQVGRQGPAAIHSKSTALCHIAVRSALKNFKDTPGVGECPS